MVKIACPFCNGSGIVTIQPSRRMVLVGLLKAEREKIIIRAKHSGLTLTALAKTMGISKQALSIYIRNALGKTWKQIK